MKKQLIIVGIIVLLVTVGLSGCLNEDKKTMTYAELMSDVKLIPSNLFSIFTLQSYKNGEVLYIKDIVYNVTYLEDYEPSGCTLVSFANSSSIEGFPLGFTGDKRNEYPVGGSVNIPVHVKTYDIEGESVIWLEEWYTAYVYMMMGLAPQAPSSYLSPEEVLGNKSEYINQTISVRGYYILNPDPVIVSTLSTTADALKLDYSNIDNATDYLITGHQYLFTGTLIEDESDPISLDVILVLENIEQI